MTTSTHAFRSQVIQSVKVHSMPKPSVFVITQDPVLMDVVREFLLQLEDREVSVIWLTSVESACRRLRRGDVATVVVDGANATSEEALNRLHASAPEARVFMLTDEPAPRGLA